jgi:hypothetical protein
MLPAILTIAHEIQLSPGQSGFRALSLPLTFLVLIRLLLNYQFSFKLALPSQCPSPVGPEQRRIAFYRGCPDISICHGK